ncbi:hypothetical protein BDM02DRAFT_3113535 [Thelephora ganbajun]|uniref:Uncharacterized protein n=1 Tax=Thelephora ganbajun TaxID=370292 RepID=A0ACB6ZIY7_THEGA|nr:hypothetical protein BDM02DRAFT_3113535 [Thelephora ganbajun]
MARAFLFFGLNLARFISILSFVLVLAGSFYVMVTDIISVSRFRKESGEPGKSAEKILAGCDYIRNSTVPYQTGGIAWAVINRLFIIAQVTILAFSELGWFKHLFDRFFPVVGPEFGLGPLGVFQCLIGGTVLSHHVGKFTLVSGFFLFSIGCLNIIIGLILGVAAKRIRSGGMGEFDSLVFGPSIRKRRSVIFGEPAPGAAPGPSGSLGLGFGKQAGKAASMKGIPLPQSPPPLPTYSPPRPPGSTSRDPSSTS